MKCKKCGSEIIEGAKFCTKCGNRVIEQIDESDSSNANQKDNSENSFDGELLKREKSASQNNNTDKIFTERCSAFFKAVTEFVMKWGEIIFKEGKKIKEWIREQVNTEPIKRSDSRCPFCDGENTIPIVKNEVTEKSKGYSYGQGCCGICLLGPFGLLCGLCGSESEIESKSITWWSCKNCGKQHLAQNDAKEMLDMLFDKMIMNCLCYGSVGSLFLHPLLNEVVQGTLHGFIVVIIAVIAGVVVPLVLVSDLFDKVDKQLGYSAWGILEVEKKKTYWNSVKLSMASLSFTLIMVYPILLSFAE